MGWDLENIVMVMEGWQEGVSGESIDFQIHCSW